MKQTGKVLTIGVVLLSVLIVSSGLTFAQGTAQQTCGLPTTLIKEVTETTLPLTGGSLMVQDKKYYSRSGDYYLVFQKDGNLVVNDATGKRGWGFDSIFPDISRVKCVVMQKDGNLVARDAGNNFLWAAVTKDPDPGSELVVNPRGALQLVSVRRGVVWSSDNDLTTEIDRLHADSKTCRLGLALLSSNMYKHPENPKTAPAGRRAWTDVYKEFSDKNLKACRDVGAFIMAHEDEPILSQVEKAIAASGVAGWENYFNGRFGILSGGDRIPQYCPALHLIQFDCVAATTRSLGSIAGAQKALDLLDKIECMPATGWAYCRKIGEPKITILGTSNVSQSALDNVEKIYTDMTSRFAAAYPKNKMDNFVVYMTNKGHWSEVSKLEPVGSMWLDPNTGLNEGDELRGGASTNYLWIDEQMICKRGVQTRKDNFKIGTRPTADDDIERTFDQVIHEFAHSIDARNGLSDRIKREFPGDKPEEQFAAAVQAKFGAPKREFTLAQTAFLAEIFTSDTIYSCADYKLDAP